MFAASRSGLNPAWIWPTAATQPASATLIYLEINGWLLNACGTNILIDPILEGGLDFGIPFAYDAVKRVLPSKGLVETLPQNIDALLITQGLDDHAHERTLEKLARRLPQLTVIAPPSAKPIVERHFPRAQYVTSRSRRIDLPYFGLDALPMIRLPRGSAADRANVGGLSITATSGALVGPPWQRRENGYVVRPVARGEAPSLYIEPHVEYDAEELAELTRAHGPVDAVITPISGQTLPGFELVHGPSASVDLVRTLAPRWVLPMGNGAVDARGLAAPYVTQVGSREEFESGLRAAGVSAEVLDVVPGEALTIALPG